MGGRGRERREKNIRFFAFMMGISTFSGLAQAIGGFEFKRFGLKEEGNNKGFLF